MKAQNSYELPCRLRWTNLYSHCKSNEKFHGARKLWGKKVSRLQIIAKLYLYEFVQRRYILEQFLRIYHWHRALWYENWNTEFLEILILNGQLQRLPNI